MADDSTDKVLSDRNETSLVYMESIRQFVGIGIRTIARLVPMPSDYALECHYTLESAVLGQLDTHKKQCTDVFSQALHVWHKGI